MKRFSTRLVGTSPIMFDPMTKQQLLDIRAKTPKPKGTEITIEEEAASKIYRDENGKAGIPIELMYGALVNAGRHVDLGNRKKVSTQDETILYSILTLDGTFFPFLNGAKHEVDVRAGKNKDGQTVPLVRPKFCKWEITVTGTCDETSQAVVQKLFQLAGVKAGIGAFRPSCRGPFGCFRVEDFEVTDMR